jgi:hypothetical protein
LLMNSGFFQSHQKVSHWMLNPDRRKKFKEMARIMKQRSSVCASLLMLPKTSAWIFIWAEEDSVVCIKHIWMMDRSVFASYVILLTYSHIVLIGCQLLEV